MIVVVIILYSTISEYIVGCGVTKLMCQMVDQLPDGLAVTPLLSFDAMTRTFVLLFTLHVVVFHPYGKCDGETFDKVRRK